MWTVCASMVAVAQVAPAVSPEEEPAIREMIRDQLAAFERDDAAGAWEHVAPVLRAKFGTADRFMEVVRNGYRPVYRPRSVEFRQLSLWEGEPAQWLEVTDADGVRWRALYLLEKQTDGKWRSTGCLLFRVDAWVPRGV